MVLEKDGAYIAVKALRGLTIQEHGPNQFREFISRGKDNVWVVRVGSLSEYGSLDAVFSAFKELKISTDGISTLVTDEKRTEYLLEPGNLLKVNGEEVYHYPETVMGTIRWRERTT